MTIENRIKALDPKPEDINTRLRKAEAGLEVAKTLLKIQTFRLKQAQQKHAGYKGAWVKGKK